MNKRTALSKISTSHPAFLVLQEAIRKELRLKRIFTLGLCLVGAVCLYFFWKKTLLLSIVAAIAFLAGGILSYKFFRENAENTPLIHLLRHEPEKIVWVYSVVTQRMPFGLRFMENGVFYFKLITGDDVTLGVPQSEIPSISAYLNTLLPHATFGYSEDRAQWYRAAPEMLLRYEEE